MLAGGRATATCGGWAGADADSLGAAGDGGVAGARLGSGVFTIGSGAGGSARATRGGEGGAGRGAGAARGASATRGAGAFAAAGGDGCDSGGATGREGLPRGAFSSGRSGAMSTRRGSPRLTYVGDCRNPGIVTNGTKSSR